MEIHVIINSHNKSLNGPMAMPGNMQLIPGHGQIGQKRAIFEIFKPFKSNQLYAYIKYGVCPCQQSFPNFFGVGHSSGFLGISCMSCPKLDQKSATYSWETA